VTPAAKENGKKIQPATAPDISKIKTDGRATDDYL